MAPIQNLWALAVPPVFLQFHSGAFLWSTQYESSRDMLRYSLRKSVLLEEVLYLEHQMEPVQQHIELTYIEPVRQCMENVWPLRPCSHVMVCHFTASE